MPEKSRGSVSARFSVWFSRRSAPRNASSRRARAPRARRDRARASAASPRTRWSDARLFVPASVSISVPAREVERREPDAAAARFAPRRLPVQPARRSSGGGRGRGRPRARARCACRAAAPRRRAARRPRRAAGRRCAAGTGSRARTRSSRSPEHARCERLDVHLDVGQLGHRALARRHACASVRGGANPSVQCRDGPRGRQRRAPASVGAARGRVGSRGSRSGPERAKHRA